MEKPFDSGCGGREGNKVMIKRCVFKFNPWGRWAAVDLMDTLITQGGIQIMLKPYSVIT